jgi:HPr kinase/phosphorylase
MSRSEIQVHGTCVALNGNAVLLRGASGSGKSDLALRLIDAGWALVADDRVNLRRQGMTLIAVAPPTITGRIEVRGLGLVRIDAVPSTQVHLFIDLVGAADVKRFPEPAKTEILGLSLQLVKLTPFESSATSKVRLALGLCVGDIMPGDGDD